jgi:HEPN/Toprim N-terminal domain 1
MTDSYSQYPEDSDKETLRALEVFDFTTWCQRAASLLERQWDLPEPVDEIDRRMRDDYDGWLHFDGYRSLGTLRALLDAFPNVKQVTLDVTDLIGGGLIDENEPICSRRREADRGEVRSLAPTIILAEGSSDIEILRTSLASLHPEQKDYFSFFDHRELSVDGGTSYLVKFLKAFAAASLRNFNRIALPERDLSCGVRRLMAGDDAPTLEPRSQLATPAASRPPDQVQLAHAG